MFENDSFAEMVSAEAKAQAHEGVAEFLREPENVDRWYQELVEIKMSLQAQLTLLRAQVDEAREEGFRTQDRRGFFDKKAEIEKKRSGILFFNNSVTKRMAEAKKFKNEYRLKKHRERGPDVNSQWIKKLWRLVDSAEMLIPESSTKWHVSLAELRDGFQGQKNGSKEERGD